MNPFISVIVPVYNTEKFIINCIESISNQTIKNIEIICIDDESSDNSLNLLKKFSIIDDRIKIITQKHQGVSAARNKGIYFARGKYIQFVDSDDILLPNALEYALMMSINNALDIFCFDAKAVFEEMSLTLAYDVYNTYYLRPTSYNNIMSGRELLAMMINDNNYRVAPWLYFIRRSFLINKKITFIENIIHEDNYFTTIAMLEADRVLHQQKTLYLRRVRKNSIMTTTKTFNNVYGYFRCVIGLESYLNNNEVEDGVRKAVKKFIFELKSSLNKIYLSLKDKDRYNIELLTDTERDLFLNIIKKESTY